MPGNEWSTTEPELITGAKLNDQNVRVAYGDLVSTNGQAGKIFSWQNTVVSADILVWLVLINITTGATAAAKINVGQNAAEATSDNLIDGASLQAVDVLNNHEDQGGNGSVAKLVADDEWVTGYEDNSADPADLVGKYYIFYTEI